MRGWCWCIRFLLLAFVLGNLNPAMAADIRINRGLLIFNSGTSLLISKQRRPVVCLNRSNIAQPGVIISKRTGSVSTEFFHPLQKSEESRYKFKLKNLQRLCRSRQLYPVKVEGYVHSGSAPVAFAVVDARPIGITASDEQGHFDLGSLPRGTRIIVTPRKDGLRFEPRQIDMLLESDTTLDFQAFATATVRGRVTRGDGSPVIQLTVHSDLGDVSTDQDGRYQFNSVPVGQSLSFGPQSGAYNFNPASIQAVVTDDIVQDFSATQTAFTLQGNIAVNGTPQPGVLIDGGTLGVRTSDQNGSYSFTDLPFGTVFTLTPSKAGYTFSPSRTQGTINAETTADFASELLSFNTIGRIVDSQGAGIPDVSIDAGALGQFRTDGNGNFNLGALSYGSTYLLVPSKLGKIFSPPSLSGTVTARFQPQFLAQAGAAGGNSFVDTFTQSLSSDPTVSLLETQNISWQSGLLTSGSSVLPGLSFPKGDEPLVLLWKFDAPIVNGYLQDSSDEGTRGYAAGIPALVNDSPFSGMSANASAGAMVWMLSFKPWLENYTVSAWVKLPPGQGRAGSALITSSNLSETGFTPNPQYIYELGLNSAGSDWELRLPSVSLNLGSANGQWQHLAVTYDGTFLKTYLNGAVTNQRAISPDAAGTLYQNFTMFRDSNGGHAYLGMVDDFALNGRAMSAQEIGRVSALGQGRYGRLTSTAINLGQQAYDIIPSLQFTGKEPLLEISVDNGSTWNVTARDRSITEKCILPVTQFRYRLTIPEGSSVSQVRFDWNSDASQFECSDGIDNNDDGLVDYPEDPGCHSGRDIEQAGFRGLPKDAYGFTRILDSASARKIYVSSTLGNDNWSGLAPDPTGGNDGPVMTLARGISLLRSYSADQLLLRRGDVFTNQRLWSEVGQQRWSLSGRSHSEPMVVGAYGTASVRPRIVESEGSIVLNLGSSGPRVRDLVFKGIQLEDMFPRPVGGGIGVMSASNVDNVLFEDVVVTRFFVNFINLKGSNLTIRRSQITDAYQLGDAGHAQGVKTAGVHNMLFEENLLDHNGWLEGVPNAIANIFRHNWYGDDSDDLVVFKDNIISRASNIGFSGRRRSTVINNAFVANPLAIHLQMNGRITNNIFLEGSDVNSSNPAVCPANCQAQGFGVNMGNIDSQGVLVADNIFANERSVSEQGWAFQLFDNSQHVQFLNNISYRWGGMDIEGSLIQSSQFRNNDFQLFTLVNSPFVLANVSASQLSFSGNNIYRLLPPVGPYTQTFYWLGGPVPGQNVYFAMPAWRQYVEPDTTEVQSVYPSPERTTASYMQSIGESDQSLSGFFQKARGNSEQHWDTRFTGRALKRYIEQGFGR